MGTAVLLAFRACTAVFLASLAVIFVSLLCLLWTGHPLLAFRVLAAGALFAVASSFLKSVLEEAVEEATEERACRQAGVDA